MCDYVPGQLILSHHKHDPWASALIDDIRAGLVEHVSILAELHGRLEKAQVPCSLPWRIYLLAIPEGQESWKINWLHGLYIFKRMDPSLGPWQPSDLSTADLLLVVPNSQLSLEGFNFGVDHANFAASLGPVSTTGKGVSVAVVDTGLDVALGWASSRCDLWTANAQANDNVGHGTAIATVIHDIAPDADIHVIKFSDSRSLSEWDALAGLHAAAQYDVINLSWSFGLQNATCAICGRKSHSSRSSVFENVLTQALEQSHSPIVVAAAGNQGTNSLRYPARFEDALAVGAVDASGAPAAYSNFGATTPTAAAHQSCYFAPGGEQAQPVGACVAPFPPGPQFGTSLAAAYATGVVACARQQLSPNHSRPVLLAALAKQATALPRVQNPAPYGNGLIQRI